MQTEQMNIRMDKAMKKSAERILSKIGLAPSDAVRLFYRQVILRKGLPFPVELPNAKTKAALAEVNEKKTKRGSTQKFYADLGLKD